MKDNKVENIQFVYYSLRDILESLMRDYPEIIWFKYIDILNKYLKTPFKIVSAYDKIGIHIEDYLRVNNIIKEHEYNTPVVTCAYSVTCNKEEKIWTLRTGFAYRSINDDIDKLYGKSLAISRLKSSTSDIFSSTPFKYVRSGTPDIINSIINDLTIQKDSFLLVQMLMRNNRLPIDIKKIKLTFALPEDTSEKSYPSVCSAIMGDLKEILDGYQLSKFLYGIFDMITKRLVTPNSNHEACTTIKIEKKLKEEKLSRDDVVKVFTCEGPSGFSYTVRKSKQNFDVFNVPFYKRMREKFGHMTRDQLFNYFNIPYPSNPSKDLLSKEEFIQQYETQNEALRFLIKSMLNDIRNEMKQTRYSQF